MEERTHHIVVAYEMDLLRAGSDDVLVLDLPEASPGTDRTVLVDAPRTPGIRVIPRPDVEIGAGRLSLAQETAGSRNAATPQKNSKKAKWGLTPNWVRPQTSRVRRGPRDSSPRAPRRRSI